MKCLQLLLLVLVATLAVSGPADACCGACVESQLGFIISRRELADSRFSASSQWSGSHAAHRARLDKYFYYPCSWSAAHGDAQPWVEVDLVTATTVTGIAIKKRCDAPYNNQWVKGYRVEAWVDGNWDIVHVQTTASYIGSGEFQFAYFEKPTWARKWRVVVTSNNNYPSMKFDLIGYI